jgi:hypothetical protein
MLSSSASAWVGHAHDPFSVASPARTEYAPVPPTLSTPPVARRVSASPIS